MAKSYRIHPSIGIARVGNSPEHFIGPELRGVTAATDNGNFRDASGRVRRQAARFRVFEYDDTPGAEPREVLGGGGGVQRIEWTVHLSNKKANWFSFNGLLGEETPYPPDTLRNGSPADDPQERRRRWVIDPGPRMLSGTGQVQEVSRGTGGGYDETWPGPLRSLEGDKEITSLGTLLTDDAGRLVVAGGYGKAGTRAAVVEIIHFANNPDWFDDTSDGPVTARVILDDGSAVPVDPAWVMVGPPDHAPPVENVVTMYDVLYDVAVRHMGLDRAVFDRTASPPGFREPFKPSFTAHIYPILQRVLAYRWVNGEARRHHFSLMDFNQLGTLPANDPGRGVRQNIFRRLRDPENPGPYNDGKMPKLYGDEGEFGPGATVTRTLYFMMRQWSRGMFIGDWIAPPPPDAAVNPAGLDRAALDNCCGVAFYPGMEAGWIMRNPRIYAAPFRVRHRTGSAPDGVEPGDLTKRMALPWQADFLSCGTYWWPAQRPNQVLLTPAGEPVEWDQGITGLEHMADAWHQLGFVKADGGPEEALLERERVLPRSA